MKSLIVEHKSFWSNKSFVLSVVVGILFFVGSLCFNYFALNYTVRMVGNSTTDILLDNLPIINTDIIFSEGAFLFVLFMFALFIFSPKVIPFTLKSIALFIFIRSMFVAMTHLGIPTDHIPTDFDKLRYLGNSAADEFFSGHTGLPFLMSLIFWNNKILRRIFLCSSIIAGVSVLLGHLHYTIDVFSAFFISYGIYHIALRIFKEDCKIFDGGIGVKENKTI